MYDVELIDTNEKLIVGPVLHTSFADNLQAREIPDFFHKIMEDGDLEAVPDRVDANQICAFVKPADSPEFDYYMGVEVESFDRIPAGMASLTIPACRCATTALVKRGNADVMAAMHYIMQHWMKANRLRPDFSLPAFICYDDRFLPIFRKKGYAGNPVAQLYLPAVMAA